MTSLPPRVLSIIEAIAADHGTTPDAIVGRSQCRAPSRARFAAMAAVRDGVKILGKPASYSQIGRWFGGRDHSTVIHGVQNHQIRQSSTKRIFSCGETVDSHGIPCG